MLDGFRTDFISSFPHELRIPINVIKESIAMLKEDLASGQINEKQKLAVELAENNLERLWRLSEELLELSVIALAKKPIKRTLLDITALTLKITSKYIPIAEEKKISFTSNIPEKKIEIWTSAEKFTQMMECLIDNAIKFNKIGGKVDVRLEESDKTITIIISDTGSGISAEDLDKVFDKFYRVTIKAKNLEKQWGVGLPIVKDIVDLLKGTIALKSKPGEGTSVTITLSKNLRS
jgi:signal transduction histidine kinase